METKSAAPGARKRLFQGGGVACGVGDETAAPPTVAALRLGFTSFVPKPQG
jgi:hypothetical protein